MIKALVRDRVSGATYWVEFKDEKLLRIYRDLTGVEVLETVRVGEGKPQPRPREEEVKEELEFKHYQRIWDFYVALTDWLREMEKKGYTYIVEKKDGKTVVTVKDKETGITVAVITAS